MKNVVLILLCVISLSIATDLTHKIGFEFGAFSPMFPSSKLNAVSSLSPGTKIGVKYHFKPSYAAQLAGAWVKNEAVSNTEGGHYNLILSFDQSFYLPPISKMDHMIFVDASFIQVHEIDGAIASGYGMQYMINNNLALYGKIGAGFEWIDFTWETYKSLGLIFYLK